MSVSRISYISLAVLFTFAICGLYFPTTSEAVSPPLGGVTVTTVATGLHNPRGLNFGPEGGLYVAEAAGDGTASANCGVMGDGSTKCSANTGSIARIDTESGDVTRVVTGIPSLITSSGVNGGNAGSGVQDISFQGRGNGYVSIGLGGDPTKREDYFEEAGANYARLGRFNPSGRLKLYEDLGGYEAENNPDNFVPDSNPYGILALPGKVIVADAGGNDLLEVSASGRIRTLAVFAPIPRPAPPGPPFVQAVPTSVALGPDGDYYVGVLTGGPFTVGLANVYRVPANGGTPVVAYSGFTNIIDLAFDRDGSLYVLEIAHPLFMGPGRLIRIAPDHSQTVVLGSLAFPGGVAVGKDGALYLTVGSISSTSGAVIKVEQ